jgi:hypothetical protein
MPQQQQEAVVVLSPQDIDALYYKATMQGGGVMTALFTLIGGLMWLRRRLSHDRLEVKKDSAEINLLEIVIKERNNAMEDAKEAWAKRASDAELIGKLSAQVEATNTEVRLLHQLNEAQVRELAALRNDIAALRSQLKICATCPLREKEDGTA